MEELNTDWDGSIQIEGLMRFAARGDRQAGAFARDWLRYHIEHDGKLSDADFYKQYAGPGTRILRGDPLTLPLYSANLGVAIPAYLICKQFQEEQACKASLEVANAILEISSRDRFGMLSDDEDRYKGIEFAIPDSTYWATRVCAIASEISRTPGESGLYLQQAIFQLEQGIKYFFDPQKGLVRQVNLRMWSGTLGRLPQRSRWSPETESFLDRLPGRRPCWQHPSQRK
jgi:hypothetical protein